MHLKIYSTPKPYSNCQGPMLTGWDSYVRGMLAEFYTQCIQICIPHKYVYIRTEGDMDK